MINIEFINSEEYSHCKGIYQIRNLINNFVYIGQTKDSFWNRFLNHKNRLERNAHTNIKLMKDWNLYGKENFVFEILEIGDNTVLDELERKYIKNAKEKNISYNKKNGGDHVYVSEEGWNKISSYMKNRIIKEETKQKLREINLGNKNPTRCLDFADVIKIKKELVLHINQKKIAQEYNVSLGTISAIANNRVWKHVIVPGWELYLKAKKPKKYLNKKEIEEIKLLLQMPKVNQSEIARKYGVYSSVISSIYRKKLTLRMIIPCQILTKKRCNDYPKGVHLR